MIKWLFEIDTLRLSTIDTTHSAVSYSGVIIPDSFSGIQMRWNISGNGLIAPNDVSFDVSNVDDTYTTANFEGKFCTIKLILDGVLTRTWKVKIKRAISYYGKITCTCVDFLQDHLVGDYPNTPSPKELWPSDDVDSERDDDYCVPVILGTAYIPVRSVNTGTERHYILGESGPTYTITEVKSPRGWPNSSTWLASAYTMDQSTDSGYRLLQPKIDDSVTPAANGLWRSGDTFFDMLCKYSRSDTAALTNPAEWIEYILEDFGVASADIDATTFTAADTLYDTESLTYNGGFFKKENRERILSNLLAQADSYLVCTDTVELYQFDVASQETITNVMSMSFAPSAVTRHENDSGRVHWPESDAPQDVLTGQAIVPTQTGGTTAKPTSDILECKFLVGQSQNAQRAGELHFQKQFEVSQRINFSNTVASLTNIATLHPAQVVTVNNTLYGGANSVIITDMTIGLDGRVDFTGVILDALEDWDDITPAVVTPVADSSTGLPLVDADDVEETVAKKWAGETGADKTQTKIDAGVVTTGTLQVEQGGTVAAGVTGATSGDTAVRFWAGSTYANRATAPFRVLQDGSIFATEATIVGDYKTDSSPSITGGMHLSEADGELIFYGVRDSSESPTVIEELVRIGTGTSGEVALRGIILGGPNCAGYIPLNVESTDQPAIYAECTDSYAVTAIGQGSSGKGIQAYTDSTSGDAVFARADGSGDCYYANVGVGTGYAFYGIGRGYFSGTLTAASYADNTPAYEGDALSELKKIKSKNGEIDHATLPKFAQIAITKPQKTGKKIKVRLGSKFVMEDEMTNVPAQGRNIGATVSFLTVAAQQILDRLEKLENAKTNS